jgi:hypothetical protein
MIEAILAHQVPSRYLIAHQGKSWALNPWNLDLTTPANGRKKASAAGFLN